MLSGQQSKELELVLVLVFQRGWNTLFKMDLSIKFAVEKKKERKINYISDAPTPLNVGTSWFEFNSEI